ncbi:MAG TPA: acyltransferase [Xanthobacteraceae bacterium]|nr:acyltransferase [Xanthobacteraceae bacterium]
MPTLSPHNSTGTSDYGAGHLQSQASQAVPRTQSSAALLLPGLTPLRGIAALWVVLYHYAQDFPSLHSEHASRLIGGGYLAVDLFFLLSGFVMTHVYWDSFARAVEWKSYAGFLQARVARLYPLHLVILLLFVATALTANAAQFAARGTAEPIPLEGARSLAAFLANLVMLQGIHASVLSWNYPAWSISVEFMAYLLLPALLLLLYRVPMAAKAALTSVPVEALGWLAHVTRGDFNQWDGPLALLRCGPEFVLGIVLYRIWRTHAARRICRSDAVFALAFAVVLLCLQFRAPDMAVVALFPLLLLVAVSNESIAARVLNAPLLVWLGEMSYALYLFHNLVQYATKRMLGGASIGDSAQLTSCQSLLLCAVMAAVSLLLAALAHRRIEVPGRRYLRDAFARVRIGGLITQSGRPV